MKKIMSMIVFLSTILFSCKKESETKFSQNGPVSGSNSVMKVSTSGTQTIYEVDPVILGNFQHYCQLNAPSPVVGNVACGPTSYMMAAYCIAKWADPNTAYTCSGNKLKNITTTLNSSSATLTQLKNYANSYDNSFLVATYNDNEKSSRSLTNQFIKDALTANKFVIVGVTAYAYAPSVVNNANLYGTNNNPDLNPDNDITTGSNRNYISNFDEGGSGSTKIGGHIIVLLRLVTNPDGTGIVEYIDPLAQTKPAGVSNKRYVSFTRLLNSMKYNGVYLDYDAVSIAKK